MTQALAQLGLNPKQLKELLVDPSRLLNDIERFEAERSLQNFIKLMWPVLEPGTEMATGWCLDAICDHLQAVSDGHITNLLINVPPGHMKSLTTNVLWPAYEWGPLQRPWLRYVSASYSEKLTLRDNQKCRTLINSEVYQRLWGHLVQISPETNNKTRFETTARGYKVATSTGGAVTGERGDRFIIDDPHNVIDGESKAALERTGLWFSESVGSRVNNDKSAVVCIMQRIHEEDISGIILDRMPHYTKLILPLEYEPERNCRVFLGDRPFFEDPRTIEGELLWPERFSREKIERWRVEISEYARAGQLQQRPTPRGGGMFKGDDFQIIEAAPAGGTFVRGWDLAGTDEKDSMRAAYTVGLLLQLTIDGTLIIHDVVRVRKDSGTVERVIKNTANQDGNNVLISIPQDPGSAGKSVRRSLVKQLHGFRVHFSTETGSKETRAQPIASQVEAHNVKLLRRPWNKEFLDEAKVFPKGRYKDQIDALTRAYDRILATNVRPIPVAPVVLTGSGAAYEPGNAVAIG